MEIQLVSNDSELDVQDDASRERVFSRLLASSRVFSDALSSGIVAIPCHEQFEGCEVVEGSAVAQRRVALLA